MPYIDFSDEEKAIYANIANSFMSVCPSVEPTTKYKEDIDLITKLLNDLLQKSILEEYIKTIIYLLHVLYVHHIGINQNL